MITAIPPRFRICQLITFGIAMAIQALSAQERPAKPNFVILYADDLGWQDIKSYDTEAPYSVFETPYMDQMATAGTKFLQAYSPACVCAPSRAAILTGHHPARLNFTTVSEGSTVPQPSASSASLITPYHTRQLKLEQVTLPELLRSSGYINGHIGKWHLAGPDPTEHGFDYSDGDRGVTLTLGDRTTGFTTDLDENGFAHDQTTDNALDFLGQAVASDQPFFCYYASWLVHSPWHIRTESLLIKYAAKMGYDYPLTGDEVFAPGQNNPYYAAMVEMFDYNVHRIMTYLEETDDPRWPGHKLIENTYVFLTSDNGGMENGDSNGKVTDNYPLDQGKIFQEEGGTRVPFFAIGPGIPANMESDVMINGLDLMPTMLSLAGITVPDGLDGIDLSTLLHEDPQDAQLVIDANDEVRDTMYWHFPHTRSNSTIRKGGWKLFKHYDSENVRYRLYELYDANGDRVDIEEANDLSSTNSIKTTELAGELDAWLTEVDATIPSYNPNSTTALPNQSIVPAVLANGRANDLVWVEYEVIDKAAMERVDLLYTLNGGNGEIWYRTPATITALGHAEATLPEGTTHYVFNLIDENDFLVCYPDVGLSDDGFLDSLFALSTIDPPYVDPSRQQTIFSEDFSSGSLDTGGLRRDSVGFCIGGNSAWEISNGTLSNSSLTNSTVSEGAAGCIIDLSTLDDPSVERFTLRFDYTLAEPGETLYVHVWGYVDHNSTATTSIMNHNATNGNVWELASPTFMNGYNLGNADGVFIGTEGIASDAAVSLSGGLGQKSYARTFDLSEFTTAPNALGQYDYLVLGFTRNFAGSAPSATIDNVSVSVPTSLDIVAHWAMDDGSGVSVADTSGNGFDGTAINAVWVSGQSGKALDFNGSDSTVTLPESAFASIDKEVSVSMWVFGDETQPRQDVTLRAEDGAENRVLNVHLPWSDSAVFWDAGNSGGATYDRISKIAPASTFQGKWNHWAFTKNATTGQQKIYLNGALWHSGAGLTRTMAGITAAALGSNVDGVTVNYDGKIDDVRLYDVELTEAEVLSLHQTSIANYTAFLERYPNLVDVTALSDPEKDGIANLLEYVLDGDPTTADALILPTVDASGENFVFTFTRWQESANDTTQVFQYGSDLSGWTDVNITDPVDPAVSLGPVVDGLQTISITLNKSHASDGKLFGRLKVLSSL